jgi:hypothetical protein
VKEALKGRREEMITKHKNAKTNCWRCECEGYYTLEYYAKQLADGEEIVKASMSLIKKRKRDDNDSSVIENRPRSRPQCQEQYRRRAFGK